MRASHWSTSAFAIAAIGFIGYPVLRPYSSETGTDGARAIASTAWVVSHTAAMLAFMALAAAVTVQAATRNGTWWRPAVPILLGAGLVLPYYGAEAFGLTTIAQRAVESGDPGLLDIADRVRYAPVPVAMFALGLLGLAVGGVLLARRTAGDGGLARLGGVLVAVGLVAFLPQFFAPPAVRIAHGVVLGVGTALLAVGVKPGREPR